MKLRQYKAMQCIKAGEMWLPSGDIINLNDDNEVSRKLKNKLVEEFTKHCFCYKTLGCFCSICEKEFIRINTEVINKNTEIIIKLVEGWSKIHINLEEK